jgi:3-hydroxyisobutyrate dehydrogenase-like beta-hydroxyacid dehydrogenase
METIGLVSPGAMGASIGAAATQNGYRVIWASEGRSQSTIDRAARANLEDCTSLSVLVSSCDILLGICPPHDAQSLAEQVTSLGFKGLYVDANAISPARTRSIADLVITKGCQFVDGGIIGGPAWEMGSGTRLYLSGDESDTVASCFKNSPLESIVISDQVGAASALKMSFAAYTKGSSALLSAILAVAEKEGVRSALEKQWGEEFTNWAHQGSISTSAKAWRFVGEMQEISSTFSAAGLPGDFHNGAADVYSRLAGYKDAETPPSIDDVLASLLKK